jgi:predicted phosphodiesterase
MASAWNKPQLEARLAAVDDLLRRYPDAGHRTLAKRLHDQHPMLFPTLENARCSLRGRTGNSGNRKYAEKRGQSRAARKPGEHPPLPQSAIEPWEEYRISARRVLVLSDIHLPYFDETALEAALSYGDSFGPDAVLINGDLFDFYQISRFEKDPTKPKLAAELEAGKQFFAHLASRYPKAGLFFKLGNHDERWDKYLQQNAPLLFDIPAVRNAWHEAAGITQYSVQVIGDQRPVMLGKLRVFHGHEQGRGISSPVNPARGMFLRLVASGLQGHGHRTSRHSERTADGETIRCRTTGCLCGLWPEYARINKWDHGFATVVVSEDGTYDLDVKEIDAGKVY